MIGGGGRDRVRDKMEKMKEWMGLEYLLVDLRVGETEFQVERFGRCYQSFDYGGF